MTKKDLIDIVHSQTRLTKREVSEVVNIFLNSIVDQVVDGERVDLRNFGTFYRSEQKGRQVFSPIAQKKVDVPAAFNLMFKSSKTTKKIISGD